MVLHEKGMDLSGKGGTFYFNNAGWRELFKLTYDHGWIPEGTEPSRWVDPKTGELIEQMSPNPETWESMDYFSNGFQWVTNGTLPTSRTRSRVPSKWSHATRK